MRAGLSAGALPIALLIAGNPAAAAPEGTPSVSIEDRTTAPGQRVDVRGIARATAGGRLTLEYARAGTTRFRPLATTRADGAGRFAVRARPPASGRLRVSAVPPEGEAPAVSRALPFRVVRRLDVAGRRLHVRAGARTVVRGHGAPGERVRLQARRDGRWRTLDATRVRGGGKYTARARARTPMSARTRILSVGRTRTVGRLNVYRAANASWYGPGLYGNGVACGGTLAPGTLGVAHKTLPCGTKVTLRHGRRSVRVRVIDRGPYVGSREYDLTAATAQRLHFTGVGTILTTR